MKSIGMEKRNVSVDEYEYDVDLDEVVVVGSGCG